MKNLRFWQKTYLLTLSLFLACLCGGIFALSVFSKSQSLSNEKIKDLTGHQMISAATAADMEAMNDDTDKNRFTRLFKAYAGSYGENGTSFEFRQGEDVLFSNLPKYGGEREELSLKDGEYNCVIRTVSGEKYLYIASRLPYGDKSYTFTSVYSLREHAEYWNGLVRVYIAACAAAACVMAVLLYIVLRKLSKPLEQLAHTAELFGKGDLSVRFFQKGNDEIGDLAESFNQMAQAIAGQMEDLRLAAEQKERLADNLSHEMRTPLTSIQGYAEYALLSDPGEEERAEILGYIMEESKRLQLISERLLQMAVLRQGEIDFSPVSLQEIVSHVFFALRGKADEKGVWLVSALEASCFVPGDRVLLEGLLMNLVDNAVKACKEEGTVECTITANDCKTVVAVRDTGRGMYADELQKLGEPFYRPDKARSRKEGGAGLGLALCFQIAALHGATLTFSSQETVGTTAFLTFTALQQLDKAADISED
ncbi:MAG: HAMP domain-containing histidine kinase [Oscillospiraceae bacterium]|nr:HAMP domain-containing histidine kinase [Oscillospiraceae bacterium]